MPSPAYEPSHCIVCRHAQSRVVAEPDAIQREVELLWAFHQRRLQPGTPLERLRDRVAFSQHPPFRLVACTDCGLVYRNPTERSIELESTYERECPPLDTLRLLHDAQRDASAEQASRIRRMLRSGATVLEVGSYVGAFLAAARDAGLNAIGVDINSAVNRFSRSLGLDVRDGQLEDVDLSPVDAIVVWNTFDQLADPRGTVIAARARLRPGGLLAIRVPNGAFYRRWRGRLDGRRGPVARAMLAHNNLLTFPYRWGFSRQSLSALLHQAGMTVTEAVGDVLVPTSDSFTKLWARCEERLAKGILKGAARRDVDAAPWFEIYATGPATNA
jgi:SAM-dependent methyltransferase